MNKPLFVILLVLSVLLMPLVVPLVSAVEGSIMLLTVSEGSNRVFGGTAELLLDIREGSGRIFIETMPLMKVDTQISIRFAQEFACNYLDVDCNQFDFYYTIKAQSNVVGGPSAGMPITVLTIALLGDYPLRNDTVATGTINAGGLVGPVAGIMEKARAAEHAGFRRILVPEFALPELNASNVTFEESAGIEMIRVQSIEDALYFFTGVNMSDGVGEIAPLQDYVMRMRFIAGELCNRSVMLNASVLEGNADESRLNVSDQKFGLGMHAFDAGRYYSAASYCFSADLILRQLELETYSNAELGQVLDDVLKNIHSMDADLDKIPLKTLSDLETYMIVSERLQESLDVLQDTNVKNISSVKLAYAIERYNSGVSWSRLFGMSGTALQLDVEYLGEACLKKITEAEERYDFVNLYLEGGLGDIKTALGAAYDDFGRGNYASCLFKASKAKAEANMLLSGITIPEGEMANYIDAKLLAARRVIQKEGEKGIFPILGYSYYEYAGSLKVKDPFSALTFSEYALEMSNLDMYFPRKAARVVQPHVSEQFIFGGIVGIALGCVLVALFFGLRRRTAAQKDALKVKKEDKPIRTRRKARPSPRK